MARKRDSPEEIIGRLWEAEVALAEDATLAGLGSELNRLSVDARIIALDWASSDRSNGCKALHKAA